MKPIEKVSNVVVDTSNNVNDIVSNVVDSTKDVL